MLNYRQFTKHYDKFLQRNEALSQNSAWSRIIMLHGIYLHHNVLIAITLHIIGAKFTNVYSVPGKLNASLQNFVQTQNGSIHINTSSSLVWVKIKTGRSCDSINKKNATSLKGITKPNLIPGGGTKLRWEY